MAYLDGTKQQFYTDCDGMENCIGRIHIPDYMTKAMQETLGAALAFSDSAALGLVVLERNYSTEIAPDELSRMKTKHADLNTKYDNCVRNLSWNDPDYSTINFGNLAQASQQSLDSGDQSNLSQTQAQAKNMKWVYTNPDTKHDDYVWNYCHHSTVTSIKLAPAAENVETENITSVDKPDFAALKKKFYTNHLELEQFIKKIFMSDNALEQCMELSLSMRYMLGTIDQDDLNEITQYEYHTMRSVQQKNESFISPLLLYGNTAPAPQDCNTTYVCDTGYGVTADVKKTSRMSDLNIIKNNTAPAASQNFSTASVWNTSAAKVKKSFRMSELTNLKKKFKNDCSSATFTLNSLKFDDMGPIYAKVQETLVNMSVYLETIKEDFKYQVTNEQIVSMSSKLEDLTTRVNTCMSNLDKKPLNSTAVYGDQEEYTDEATAGDTTENVSSIESGGDWDIFCLERCMQPDGQIFAVMHDISPIESDTFKQKHSLGSPKLYMDLCNKHLQVSMHCFPLIRSDAIFPRFNLARQARYLVTIMDLTCLDWNKDKYFLCWQVFTTRI